MTDDIKRLAAISIFCFFPTGLAGLWLYKRSENTALLLFKISIYTFLAVTSGAGIYIVIAGGNAIPILGSFF
jgi:hypothetical protein